MACTRHQSQKSRQSGAESPAQAWTPAPQGTKNQWLASDIRARKAGKAGLKAPRRRGRLPHKALRINGLQATSLQPAPAAARIAGAISGKPATRSAAPARMASRGIPKTTQVASS